MLWIKAFHIIFMVTWFAGLFYLPRLFVYHAQVEDPASRERFVLMERRLFLIMSIGATATILLGLMLIVSVPTVIKTGWLHAKLALVLALLAYHVWLGLVCRNFRAGLNTRTHRFYRWANEVPTLFLVAIVILAVVKPF